MPDNSGYYHAAYVLAGVIYAGYTATLWWRVRSARQRLTRDAEPRD